MAQLGRVPMSVEKPGYEVDPDAGIPDPDEVPIKDRKVVTQPYDLVVESLISQIKDSTIFLRPLTERPNFQRRYVWPEMLASRLIESILINVPIPPCYLSQNSEFELDVIDGQQRLFSVYRFLENQFALEGLEVLTEFNGRRFFELPHKLQRQLQTHTLRCVVITNESHPEIKFDVFERLNTNTVPLNAQELRNCIYRGALNDLLQIESKHAPWLSILNRKAPDKRLADEELILRFFAFETLGLDSYKTPLKHWLNEAAKSGRRYPKKKIAELQGLWHETLEVCLVLFEPAECFRRKGSRAINKALFDLIARSASKLSPTDARKVRAAFRKRYYELLEEPEFSDLISRAVDHKKRTLKRFELWDDAFKKIL